MKPQFHPRPRRKLSVILRSYLMNRYNRLHRLGRVMGMSEIQYTINQTDGDYTSYLPSYEPQMWGKWDSDSCWMLGGFITPMEICFKWLWMNGMFSTDDKNFFVSNGLCDSFGSPAFSEQFLEILGGNGVNGGTVEEAVQLGQRYGVIPRSMLCYSQARANACQTEAQFENDYFNMAQITPAMRTLGQQFLQRISISYQRIGKIYQTPNVIVLSNMIKQAPFALGVPARSPAWNNTYVQWDGYNTLTHEVCGYKQNGYGIRDQYQPSEKTLSPDFPLLSVVQLIVNVVRPQTISPIPQPTSYWKQFFTNLIAWWNNNPLPFPSVPIGGLNSSPKAA